MLSKASGVNTHFDQQRSPRLFALRVVFPYDSFMLCGAKGEKHFNTTLWNFLQQVERKNYGSAPRSGFTEVRRTRSRRLFQSLRTALPQLMFYLVRRTRMRKEVRYPRRSVVLANSKEKFAWTTELKLPSFGRNVARPLLGLCMEKTSHGFFLHAARSTNDWRKTLVLWGKSWDTDTVRS